MMRGIVWLSVFFLMTAVITVGAYASVVQWSANRPIGWSDFRGSPPVHSGAEAALIDMRVSWRVTYTVVYDPARQMWAGRVDPGAVVVENTMDPAGSWVVPGREDPVLLDHERRHFDLNEVYARKLAQALSGVSAAGTSKEETDARLRRALHARATRVLTVLKEMQAGYDDQTGHGTNHAEQRAWDAQIAAWLLVSSTAPATLRDANRYLSSKMAVAHSGGE